MIGCRAFAKCTSLRSFSIPRLVEELGSNCFNESICLYQLRFASSESLKMVIGDESVDDALDKFGVTTSSGLFRIEVEAGEIELKFPGWVSIDDGEGDFEFSLVMDLQ
jgi:hypothetical protein